MSPENFVYWLQGLFELDEGVKTLNEKQVKMIKEHLHYVFTKGTPAPQKESAPEKATILPTPTGALPQQAPYTPWFTQEELDRLRREAEERNKRWQGIAGGAIYPTTVIC